MIDSFLGPTLLHLGCDGHRFAAGASRALDSAVCAPCGVDTTSFRRRQTETHTGSDSGDPLPDPLLAPRQKDVFTTRQLCSSKLWLPSCFRWSGWLPTRSSARCDQFCLSKLRTSLRTTFTRKGSTSDRGLSSCARLLTENYISQKTQPRLFIRPRSTVLHHIFARGPPELQLPDSDVQPGLHATNHNASRIYYSHWMDSIAQRAMSKADALVGRYAVAGNGSRTNSIFRLLIFRLQS